MNRNNVLALITILLASIACLPNHDSPDKFNSLSVSINSDTVKLREAYRQECVKGIVMALDKYDVSDRVKRLRAEGFCNCFWAEIAYKDILYIDKNKGKQVYTELVKGKYKDLNDKCMKESLQRK